MLGAPTLEKDAPMCVCVDTDASVCSDILGCFPCISILSFSHITWTSSMEHEHVVAPQDVLSRRSH